MDKLHPNFIQLKQKLLIPNLSGTIERERLHPLFSEIKNKKITTITAGAGYGKSTLVAQACKYLDINTVWYRLDASDSDFLTFIYYLIAGIKEFFVNFGDKTTHRINATRSLQREQKSIIAAFLSEIEEVIKENLILVLDDYHLVDGSPEIREVLISLTEYLPETIHLIIISRNIPDLNLSRFIAKRQSFDIGERELSFNTQEIDSLYKEIFNQTLNKKNLEKLYTQTEGWISGLVLFNYSIEDKTDHEIEEQLSKAHLSRKVFFDYLEENIFASLDENVIDFLLKTSVLSQLDIKFCNHLLGITNSREILSTLEKRHLFTFPFDENKESYYYHHLFQSFLHQKLNQTLDDESRGQFFQRAAGVCMEFDKPEEAIQHYLSAELYEEACCLLNTLGRQLVTEGRLSLFISLYDKIPHQYIKKNPWIQYSYARALAFSAKVYEAVEAYKKAQKMFQDCNIGKGVGLSLNRLFSYYYLIGDFIKAGDKLKELLIGVQETPRLYIDVLGHLIFICSRIGRFEEADQYFDAAEKGLKGLKETDLHAWIYTNYGYRLFTSGDLSEAKHFGEKSNKIANRLKLNYISRYSYSLISLVNYYRGNFEEGFKAAVNGLKKTRERGAKDATYAWLLIEAGFCASANGDTTAAINFAKEGLKISQELESPWSEAWAYHVLQDAYLNEGNLFESEKSARLAVNAIEHATLPQYEGVMKGMLSSVLLEKGDLRSAEVLLNEAEKQLDQSKLNLCRVRLWYARYYWLKHEITPSLDKLRSALYLSNKNQYDAWIVYEKRWIIPLLIEIYSEKELQDYINQIFIQLGSTAVGYLKQLEKSKDKKINQSVSAILTELNKNLPSNLSVYCFGKFGLFRGSEEIPSENWSSEKAKMLFKYLIYHHDQGYIIKDKLLELLWPDEDPEVTSNRFHVAMTALRKVLEPELPKGMASSYLLRNGESYKVNLTEKCYLDIADFENELASAKKAKDEKVKLGHYIKAESLYRGDFFEEDQYDQWCIEAREDYKEKYLSLLDYIITYYNQKKRHVLCIEYAKKYLAVDEYAEEIYQVLMRSYNETGNKSMVIKTYERCKFRIEEDLDCPLSDETNKLYKQLRG